MRDISQFLPLIIMTFAMLLVIIGMLICLKVFYKKARPGEVIILNTLEAKPKIIRNGALVMPIIHSASTIDLKSQIIDIKTSIIDKVNKTFSLDLSNFSVQVKDSEQDILKAYQRINIAAEDSNHMSQLKSILEQSIQEGLLSINDYEEFKSHLSRSLGNIGYELVV